MYIVQILNKEHETKRLGKNSILGENEGNLPPIKRIVSKLFNA